MRLVYLNGDFVPEAEAKVSVFDRGFLYGDGIFETVRSYGGKIFRLKRHIERLFTSANILSISLPHDAGQFCEIVKETLRRNHLNDASLRLSVSRGPGAPGLSPAGSGPPTVLCTARELPPGLPQLQKSGVRAVVVQTRRTPPPCLDSRAKTFNFLNNIVARLEVDAAGAFEGIMLNTAGKVAEGTVSNVFFYSGGVLYTPSPDAGILPGIARETVLEAAAWKGVRAGEGLFGPEDLFAAGEVFLTNSNWEVLPVVQLDGMTVGKGVPGPATTALAAAYNELVRAEEG
ncbi:MAG: aminotransferase class IV [Firmicutes bacterium]|nr:aminotransferase class IV [Bacillota bacterium]